MTFQELENKIGKQNAANWHQHKNGGGWVSNTATVDEKAFISSDAIVWHRYTIAPKVMHGGEMHGGEMHGGEMHGGVMRGGVMHGGEMWGGEMWGGEMWGGEMWGGEMRGGEMRGGEMWGGVMRGGDWKKSMLFILDSRAYGCSNCKPGHLQIGCQCHTFSDWKKLGKAIAKKENFTAAEVKEYMAIVELFCKIGV